MLEVLRILGIPEGLRELTYTKAKVRFQETKTEEFNNNQGVKQSDIIHISNTLHPNNQIKYMNSKINIKHYAAPIWGSDHIQLLKNAGKGKKIQKRIVKGNQKLSHTNWKRVKKKGT